MSLKIEGIGTVTQEFRKLTGIGGQTGLGTTVDFGDGEKEDVYRCSSWGVDVISEISYISQGDLVLVTGTLRRYKNKKTGQWEVSINLEGMCLAEDYTRELDEELLELRKQLLDAQTDRK